MSQQLNTQIIAAQLLKLIKWCSRKGFNTLPTDDWLAEKTEYSTYAIKKARRLLQDIGAIQVNNRWSDYVPRNGKVVEPCAFARYFRISKDAEERLQHWRKGNK